MIVDLAVRGGRVVLEEDEREADVLIRDGRIVEIVDPGDGRAAERLDARGLVVLPGVVDAHVHFNEPGRAEWEGWEAGTRGAAAGGVTTVLDMPLNSIPPTVDLAAFAAKREVAARAAVVDFALWGGIVRDDARAMAELHAAGAIGFKAFLCDSGVPEFPPVDEATLRLALEAAARLGAVVGVHAEDQTVLDAQPKALREIARGHPRAWAGSRPVEAELAAVARVLAHAEATSAHAHLLHVSSADAIRLVRERDAASVTAETCPHYLVFSDDDLVRLGPVLKCAPPFRDGANRERLWRAVLDGAVDLVASDHSPCARDLKERGAEDIFAAWGGITGVQSLLPALLTEGVHRRGLRLTRLAALVAANPARRFGLYPRKGAILPGADADLALVDLERRWTLAADALFARSGLSPYVGREFRGAVVRTLVRGRVVYEKGEITVAPGHGRFVPRERRRYDQGQVRST